MYDAVDLTQIPAGAAAVAGYVDGKWPTYAEVQRRWPDAHHLSIATSARHDADCLDVEAGDAAAPQVASWLLRQLERGVKRPHIYASVSRMQGLVDLILSRNIKRAQFRLWTAHYGRGPHRCTSSCGFGFHDEAGATQWTDGALGRSLDASLVFGPAWFPAHR